MVVVVMFCVGLATVCWWIAMRASVPINEGKSPLLTTFCLVGFSLASIQPVRAFVLKFRELLRVPFRPGKLHTFHIYTFIKLLDSIASHISNPHSFIAYLVC